MSNTTAIAENRTIFDGRPISEGELEVTESGDYALYIAERPDLDTDEIHILTTSDENRDYSSVYEALQTLTADSDQPVSEVGFKRGADGRLILQVDESQAPEDSRPGHDVANYLLDAVYC